MFSTIPSAIEGKLTPVKDFLPNITGEYLRQLITSYHNVKAEESNAWLKIWHPTSKFLHALQFFYNDRLNKKSERLNSAECFELAKIIFIKHYKLGKKSTLVKLYLSQYFDVSIIATFVAFADNIDVLHNHFDAMCKQPKAATDIAFAVIAINNHMHTSKISGSISSPYLSKLNEQISEKPDVASAIVEVYRLLFKRDGYELPFEQLARRPSIDFPMTDRVIYLLVQLKQADLLTPMVMEKLLKLTHKKLNNLALEVFAYPDSLKKFMDLQFLDRGLTITHSKTEIQWLESEDSKDNKSLIPERKKAQSFRK